MLNLTQKIEAEKNGDKVRKPPQKLMVSAVHVKKCIRNWIN